MTIVDRSGYSVRLTLWGKQAEHFTQTDQPVVAWKGVKVTEFSGMVSHGQTNIIRNAEMLVRPFALYDQL